MLVSCKQLHEQTGTALNFKQKAGFVSLSLLNHEAFSGMCALSYHLHTNRLHLLIGFPQKEEQAQAAHGAVKENAVEVLRLMNCTPLVVKIE